ncbi:MAG: carboxypeptidase regulatory-like domain-containing protein [Planctomycetaceae bacterium]
MQKFLTYTLAALFVGVMPFVGCSDKGAATKTNVVIKPNDTEQQTSEKQNASTDGAKGAAAGFGSFKGKVVMQGTAPQLEALVRKGANIKDADVCAAQDIPNEKLVVGPSGGVANVFVYLQTAPPGAKTTDPPADPVLFDQKGCHFIPHALFVQVGRPLQVVSGDEVAHNTHTKPVRGTQFNAIINKGDRVGVKTTYSTFENQPIPVNCDFHAWMFAWHLPLEHPFAAVTDEKGEFEIAELPAGTHKFKVWHEGAGFLERNLSVTVNANAVTEQEIPYPATKFKP